MSSLLFFLRTARREKGEGIGVVRGEKTDASRVAFEPR